MSSTDRLNRLLLAEDWKRVYQSYKNADFKSYDFDTLRRTMVQYLRDNYPEDFNDYIESSEYLALIDLIAFLGQNISYRIDLNARENFLELADRRDSVLKLARLISYNATRNQAANGLLKFDSLKTTESIVDSNGNNLADQVIIWNDPSNTNWAEQFKRVLNSALPQNNTIGKPSNLCMRGQNICTRYDSKYTPEYTDKSNKSNVVQEESDTYFDQRMPRELTLYNNVENVNLVDNINRETCINRKLVIGQQQPLHNRENLFNNNTSRRINEEI